MWQSFSKYPRLRAAALVGGLVLWVFLGFMLAQAVIIGVLEVSRFFGASFAGINPALFNTIASAVTYILALVIIIGAPWWVRRARTTKQELGLQRLPTWLELLWAPAGAVVYLILASLMVWLAMTFLPFIDFEQVQDTGFNGISHRYEYILAFISLVVIAPVAEEVLFRGYLFGKLRKRLSLWLSILITSLLFAIVHFAWNVGIDVFVLSVVLCLLRVISGSLWPSIFLHMLKNGIAFYLLFVVPALSTIGG